MAGIFISHSSVDRDFVFRLASDLLNAGFPVWFDNWELELGDSLTSRIFDGIDKSTFLFILLSDASINSSWVQKELRDALAKEERLGRKFIIPIKISNCEVPLSIADRLYCDLSTGYLSNFERLVNLLGVYGAEKAKISSEKQLVPLLFTQGVHLNKAAFQRRLDFLDHNCPDYRVAPAQVIFSTDPSYIILRNKLTARLENVERDEYFSPTLEQYLNWSYDFVKLSEKILKEGVAIAINWLNQVAKGLLLRSETCYWLCFLIRTQLLNALWECQNPAHTDNLEYGREYAEKHLASKEGASQLYGVSAFSCTAFDDNRTFHLWIDSDHDVARELKGFFPAVIRFAECDFQLLRKYVIPQVIYSYLRRHRESEFDLDFAKMAIRND